MRTHLHTHAQTRKRHSQRPHTHTPREGEREGESETEQSRIEQATSETARSGRAGNDCAEREGGEARGVERERARERARARERESFLAFQSHRSTGVASGCDSRPCRSCRLVQIGPDRSRLRQTASSSILFRAAVSGAPRVLLPRERAGPPTAAEPV
eukprot:726413-Pleurochrysis_carterae.AAC.1